MCCHAHIPWQGGSLNHQGPKPTSSISRKDVLNSGFSVQFKDLHVLYDKGKQEQPGISREVENTHEK